MDISETYKKPTLKAIHICNSHEPPFDQKLQKSMSLSTHGENKMI